MNIEGASALVTGGASGLGLATARALHESGTSVVIVDLPSSRGAAIAEENQWSFAAADVSDPDAVERALDAAESMGPLKVVVNCAGIATPNKVLDRDGVPVPIEQFERIIRVNLIGTYTVISRAAARISRNEPDASGNRGVVVNTASVAAFEGQIGQPAYSASKGGVHAMTIPLAREFARYGIRVVTIAPGLMETPLVSGLPEAAQRSLAEQVPFPPRLGMASEYGELVRHIVANDYLNGETIRLDGAIRMAPR